MSSIAAGVVQQPETNGEMSMPKNLPQKYQQVAKEIIPYTPDTSHQMALIDFEPALPCFICSRPATVALIAPAPEHAHGAGTPWLTFPICSACEERQVKSQSGELE
jgi:hypothetical protein